MCMNSMMYKMTCSCGDTMDVEGATREEAAGKLKAMMTEEAIAAHMKEHHPGEPVIPVAVCHAMIDKELVAA